MGGCGWTCSIGSILRHSEPQGLLFEVAAIMAIVLVFLVRKGHPALAWSLAGAPLAGGKPCNILGVGRSSEFGYGAIDCGHIASELDGATQPVGICPMLAGPSFSSSESVLLPCV